MNYMPNIQILSKQQNIRTVSNEILANIKKAGKNITDDILFDIKLCVEEAIRNAMVHGNKRNESLPVSITYQVDSDRITLIVEDKGEGFNFAELPDPTEDQNLYKESGRGVFIIRKLMDKVIYNEKGNRIKMEKRLT